MRRAMIVVCALGVVGAMGAAIAQQPGGAETRTLVGCLQPDGDSGRFRLDNALDVEAVDEDEGASYRLAGIVPPGVRLADHVGHEVRVTGAVTSSDDGSSINMYAFEHVAPACGSA